MERERVRELHYITPVENLPSMARYGLVSHERARSMPHSSVALDSVQNVRATRRVPRGGRLHQYVNLYLDARNSMMFYLKENEQKPIVVLRIDTAVLDLPHVAISDGNAASDITRFYPSPDGLAALTEELVFAESWNHPDYWTKRELKRKRCAEVLVPHRIPVEFIKGILAADPGNSEVGRDFGWPGEVNPYVFFR